MNKNRRKRIEKIVGEMLEHVEALKELRDEEQEALDNMPENLMESEKYTTMEDGISNFDCHIDAVESELEEITQELST